MAIRDTIINAIVGAAVVATGGSIISLKVADASQNEQIVQLQDLRSDVRGLRGDLQRVDRKLSYLNGKLGERTDGEPSNN